MTPAQADAALATMTDADFPTSDAAQDLSDDDIAQLAEQGRRALAGRPSLTAPGTRSPRINLRLPQPLRDQLAAAAAEQHRRQSDIARDAIAQYLSDARP
jgi:cytochrome c553